MYLRVILYPQKKVIFQPFLAVFTSAVKVVLLLELLLAFFTDIKKIDIGHCQFFSFCNLAQGPEFNSEAEKRKRVNQIQGYPSGICSL